MIAYLNTLSADDCENLIQIFHRYPQSEWDQSLVVNLSSVEESKDFEFLSDIIRSITKTACTVMNALYFPEYADITMYADGCGKKLHFDNTRESTALTSITYLNNNFEGGNTVFQDITVKPTTGKTAFFDGKKYLHGVQKVAGNRRFALAIWYSKEHQNSIL